MAKIGRPPKPTALHVLNGNPSKIKDLGKNEPKPIPIASKRPAWLTGEGKKLYDKLAPQLETLGLLTAIDGEAFAAACQSWKTYVECQRYLKKKGLTYEYGNSAGRVNETVRPQVRIGNMALDRFRAFCTEFGLTPAARTRIEVKTDTGAADPAKMFLSGMK